MKALLLQCTTTLIHYKALREVFLPLLRKPVRQTGAKRPCEPSVKKYSLKTTTIC